MDEFLPKAGSIVTSSFHYLSLSFIIFHLESQIFGHFKNRSGTAPSVGHRSQEMTLQLREALIQAVRRCVAGEEHVGLLFSGGLDSGLLAWLFTEELAPCRCSCYTVGFHMEDKKIKNKQLNLRLFKPLFSFSVGLLCSRGFGDPPL